MFNYGGYLNNGGNTGAANPITGVSPACRTSTTPACPVSSVSRPCSGSSPPRASRHRTLRAFRLPGRSDDIPGLIAYRALLDKYGLQAGGWHGSMSEANWDMRVNAGKILGADYIGSGGVGDPGIGSYSNTLHTAETLNRLGKRSVEAGLGPAYIHNHKQEFRTKYVHNGVMKTAFDILMDRTDSRYVNAELDVFWSSDAFEDVTGTQTAALINKWATRMRLLHIKDGINVDETANGNPRRSAPAS